MRVPSWLDTVGEFRAGGRLHLGGVRPRRLCHERAAISPTVSGFGLACALASPTLAALSTSRGTPPDVVPGVWWRYSRCNLLLPRPRRPRCFPEPEHV